jgi:hypothetical protein
MLARRALLLTALGADAARAEEPPLIGLVGGNMVGLAAHPAVRLLKRYAARGFQQHVYAGLRLPGPPIAVHDNWLIGWGREGQRGLFMAFQMREEQLVLFLLVDGRPTYLSPRSSHWPPALAEPFAAFRAAG